MYVVKVGEYYVKKFRLWDAEIELSNEVMLGMDKEEAEKIAKAINGVVVEIKEEVTND